MTFSLTLKTDGTTSGINYDSENAYEVISQAVGGYIEVVQLTPKLFMYLNEEGKLLNLEINRFATEAFWQRFGMLSDVIVGDVVFASHNEEGEVVSLENEEMQFIERIVGKFEE